MENDKAIYTFITALALIVCIVGGYFWVNTHRIEAGNVGIKVHLLGNDKGVNSEELGPGRHFAGLNQDIYTFPTFSQNYVWTQSTDEGSRSDESLTFQSVEGMDIGADVGITYSVDPTKVSDLFQRYRAGIEEITDTYLRNMVRDALVSEASVMRVNEIYGTGKVALMDRVEASVQEQVALVGINLEKIYWIGSLRLPDKVVAAIDEEIAANSRARRRENEVAEAIAEADKERERAEGEAEAILLRAAAQAEANALIADSLTPGVLSSLAIERWNGVMPMMSGEDLPLISFDASSLSTENVDVESIRQRADKIRDRVSPEEPLEEATN